MDVDTYVGPHKDSDKVFVINQQHPHSKKFNEHKVMLGYKDRAHAVHDYVHSFADGLGHKRVQSIVEMDKSQLKDWIKHGRHTKPIKKADGGEVSLLERKQAEMDPRKALLFGETDQALPPAGLPIGQAVGTEAAVGVAKGLMAGSELARRAIEEGKSPDYNNPEDIGKVLEAVGVGIAGGLGGAPEGAVLGAGPILKRGVKAAERELTPLGFYSHGAETAANLPQAKGTPQQFKSMLEKNGVKPAEMEGFDAAFADRPSVTRDEVSQFFKENMPQVEEKVLGRGTSIDKIVLEDHGRGNEYVAYDAQGRVMGAGPTEEAARRSASFAEKQGENPTKFDQYTLPGGENYREVLLKLPSEQYAKRNAMVAARAEKDKLVDQYGAMTDQEQARAFYPKVQEAIKKYNDSVTAFQNSPNPFTSGHWDDPNVLAHLRMSDRTGPNGEKILHVEEIQSDWGQKGKKVGFSDPASKAAAKEKMDQLSTKYDELGRERRLAEKEMAELPDYNDRFGQLQNRVSEIGQERDLLSDQMAELRSTIKGDAIPSAPYVTNTQAWTDLALKRALKEAAEGGYDKLVWTPGVEQAKRYKLSNHINAIDYMREGEDAYRLGITNKHGEGIDLPKDVFTAKELEDYLGKEVAQKIVEDEGKSYRGRNHKTLEGIDLEVGGSGMKGYYDKIVPTQLSKLVKKLDPEAKIGSDTIGSGKYEVVLPNGKVIAEYPEKVSADIIARKQPGATVRQNAIGVPSLTITPKMREAILGGQTAYAKGGTVAAPDHTKHAALVSDIRGTAKQHGFQRPAVAHMIKMMGVPSDRAARYAHNVLSDPHLHHKINPMTEKFLVTLNGAMKHTAAQKHMGDLRRHLRNKVIYGNP